MAETHQNDAVPPPPSTLELELNIARLNICENKPPTLEAELKIDGDNKFLDEPEDSNISTVRPLSRNIYLFDSEFQLGFWYNLERA